MNRQDQVGLLKRLLHYVDTRTTSMADAPWRNDVSVYTDAHRLTQEQQILFRQHPIVMVSLRSGPHRAASVRMTMPACRFWSYAGAMANCARF